MSFVRYPLPFTPFAHRGRLPYRRGLLSQLIPSSLRAPHITVTGQGASEVDVVLPSQQLAYSTPQSSDPPPSSLLPSPTSPLKTTKIVVLRLVAIGHDFEDVVGEVFRVNSADIECFNKV